MSASTLVNEVHEIITSIVAPEPIFTIRNSYGNNYSTSLVGKTTCSHTSPLVQSVTGYNDSYFDERTNTMKVNIDYNYACNNARNTVCRQLNSTIIAVSESKRKKKDPLLMWCDSNIHASGLHKNPAFESDVFGIYKWVVSSAFNANVHGKSLINLMTAVANKYGAKL
jgi:hypothetical protein